MSKFGCCFALAVILVCGAGAQKPSAPGTALDLHSYIAVLDQASQSVSASSTDPQALAELQQLPEEWQVQQGGVTYRISTEWLRKGAEEIQSHPKDADVARRRLVERLILLRKSAEQTTDSAALDTVTAHSRLNEILARREFRAVHGETWFDRLRDKVLAALGRLLEKIFGHASHLPETGRLLTWIFIAAIFVLLAIVTIGWLRRRSTEIHLDLAGAMLPQRKWREWLAEALAAAKRGDYRNAIRCAYWAGVLRLEDAARWQPDRTLTPREYLKKLGPDDLRRPALAELTRSFERTWYGYQPASEPEFAQAREQLEKLGCALTSSAATSGS
jgi:hypothetical protein